MFNLKTRAPKGYQDPWNLPLQDRLKTLAAGSRRVAYFYERADNSTFRYRIYNMAEVLNNSGGEISASYFFLEDLRYLDEIATLADLLVICRTRYDNRVNYLIRAFKAKGKPVYFDIDDFVFDTDHVHLIINTLDLNVNEGVVWHDWFSYNSRLGATLKLCDAGITTNVHLAAKMKAFADIPVAVIPNFMNRLQLELSEQVYQEKRGRRHGETGLIHLGYFSGSPSHNKDFQIVAATLEELLAADERLGLVVVGYVSAGPRLEKFGDRVTYWPFMDFVSLQRAIGSVEFNLMPLQVNAFTNCKSELKYFEAAAVGTLSIASPSSVYAETISHGHNGFIAQAHAWHSVISEAVARDDHAAMAERAHDHAIRDYGWESQFDTIKNALNLP
ncbi:MAG: glycosyltransferase [Burkholderiales bacterium]|nr:glycosyltransferase [Burkholderiales bacterium]